MVRPAFPFFAMLGILLFPSCSSSGDNCEEQTNILGMVIDAGNCNQEEAGDSLGSSLEGGFEDGFHPPEGSEDDCGEDGEVTFTEAGEAGGEAAAPEGGDSSMMPEGEASDVKDAVAPDGTLGDH